MVEPHEPPPYRTPLWGWIAIVVAVAMLIGLIVVVIVAGDATGRA